MVTNTKPLESDEAINAMACAALMNDYCRGQMNVMMELYKKTGDGTWSRAIRQAVENFEQYPSLYSAEKGIQ